MFAENSEIVNYYTVMKQALLVWRKALHAALVMQVQFSVSTNFSSPILVSDAALHEGATSPKFKPLNQYEQQLGQPVHTSWVDFLR